MSSSSSTAAAAAPDPYIVASTLITHDEHIKIALDATRTPSASSNIDTASAPPPSLSPDNPRRILVIVSNVASSLEQAAILVLKPRNKDQNSAALLTVIPILASIHVQLLQHHAANSPSAAWSSPLPSSTALPSIQSILDSIPQPTSLTSLAAPSPTSDSSGALLALTISCCGQSASASTADTQGLKDFLSVLNDLTKVAQNNNFSLATSHQWLSPYTHDLPLLAHPADPAAAAKAGDAPAVPIFERFSKSAILPPPHNHRHPHLHHHHHADADRQTRPPSPAQDEIRLSVGTFNLAGQWPQHDANTTDGLKSWLCVQEEPDLVVLGFQEVDTSGGAYLYYSPAREDAWTSAAVQAMGHRAAEYTKVASKQLIGLLILVFARRSISESISDLATASVGVGLGGFVANKGAVAVRLQLARRTFCFVNSHLSAFEGLQAMERRCWDWSEIYKRLRFKIELPPTDDEQGEGEGERQEEEKKSAAALGADGEAPLEKRKEEKGEKGRIEEVGEEKDEEAGKIEVNGEPRAPSPPRPAPETEDADEAGANVEATAEMTAAVDSALSDETGAPAPTSAGPSTSLGMTYIDAAAAERYDVSKASNPMQDTAYDADADVSAAWKPWDRRFVEHSIRDHDIIINMGDLNFRLDTSHAAAHTLIQSRSYSSLYRYDQLEALRNSGSLFDDFEEGTITFAPTYKFDRGTDRYDSSDKKRVPAWTDRVLWCVNAEWDDGDDDDDEGAAAAAGGRTEGERGEEQRKRQRKGIVLQRYENVPAVRLSDHRPVRATFLVRIR